MIIDRSSSGAAELVLDSEVGEVDPVVEVRQLVFERPLRDLSCVPIRSPIALWPAAIVLLKECLVLALKLLLEDDPPNLGTLVS
jgi:hypothetical protein